MTAFQKELLSFVIFVVILFIALFILTGAMMK